MKKQAPGLHKRPGSDNWYVRVMVPTDLRHLYPNGQGKAQANLRKSLHTTDRDEAALRALAVQAQYAEQFKTQRAQQNPVVHVAVTAELVGLLADRVRATILAIDDAGRYGDDTLGHVLDLFAPQPLVIFGDPPPPLMDAEGRVTSEGLTRLRAAHANTVSTLGHALTIGQLGYGEALADGEARRLGLAVDWSKNRPAVARVMRAALEAWQVVAARDHGIHGETPAYPATPPAVAALAVKPEERKPVKVQTLADVVPVWVVESKAKPNAILRMDRALRLWVEAVGDVSLPEITKKHGGIFVTYLRDAEARKFGDSTAANQTAAINALVNVAVKKDMMVANPLDLSFEITGAENREPFTSEERAALFRRPVEGVQPLQIDPADADLLLRLQLWSGSRVGELAQARVEDVQTRDGVLGIKLTRKAGNIKTKASERFLPVASAVVEQFKQHVAVRQAAGEVRLFPSMCRRAGTPASDLFGRWFRLHRVTVGLPEGSLEGTHRFRHTVRTRLASQGVPDSVGDQITGHASRGSTGTRVYTGAIEPRALLRFIDAMAWTV